MDKQTNDLETTTATGDAGPTAAESALKAKRKRWLGLVAIGFTVIGIVYGAYWSIHLR